MTNQPDEYDDDATPENPDHWIADEPTEEAQDDTND